MYSVVYVCIHVFIHMHIHMCISYTHRTSFTLAVLLVLVVKLKLPILIQRVVTWFLMNTKTNRKKEYNTIQLSCIWIILRSVCVHPSHENSKLIFFCAPFVQCCSVLLCAAVCCSVLQCVAVHLCTHTVCLKYFFISASTGCAFKCHGRHVTLVSPLLYMHIHRMTLEAPPPTRGFQIWNQILFAILIKELVNNVCVHMYRTNRYVYFV